MSDKRIFRAGKGKRIKKYAQVVKGWRNTERAIISKKKEEKEKEEEEETVRRGAERGREEISGERRRKRW